MTKMTDTEGEQIPEAAEFFGGGALFNLTLWKDGSMSMQAPAFATASDE